MPSGETLAGFGLAAAAAACFDGAVILQAAEARTVEHGDALRPGLLVTLARRRRWLAGTLLAIAGWPLQLWAFSLAPVTLVQPTLALGLVLLLVLGRRVLGEPVGRHQVIAAAAVLAGVVGLALAGPAHASTHVDRVGATIVSAALLVVVALTYLWPGRRQRRAWSLVIGAGCAFALTAIAGKMITVELHRGRPLAAAVWLLVVIVAGVGGFLIDMSALQRFPATRVAPPMFVLETAIPVACAPVLLGEHWGQTPGGGAWLVLSLVVLLAGGASLGTRRSALSHAEHDVGGGGKPAVGEVGLAR